MAVGKVKMPSVSNYINQRNKYNSRAERPRLLHQENG